MTISTRRPFRPQVELLETRCLLNARVLAFYATAGFRHKHTDPAVVAVQEWLGARYDMTVDATEDARVFTDENLAGYDAVVFLLTSFDVLDQSQGEAFQRYIRAGGGFAGVHSASATEYDWEWFGRLVGAYFTWHPKVQEADIYLEDRYHPSTLALPDVWRFTDEWLEFDRNPRDAGATILAGVDESSYEGGAMGDDHPLVWYQHFEGGRSWYTSLGHVGAAFDDPLYLDHLAGGIWFAAGLPLFATTAAVAPTQVVVGWTDYGTDPTLYYLVERSLDGTDFEAIAALKAPAFLYEDSDVLPATQYAYRVWSFTEEGAWQLSNTTWAETPEEEPLPGGSGAGGVAPAVVAAAMSALEAGTPRRAVGVIPEPAASFRLAALDRLFAADGGAVASRPQPPDVGRGPARLTARHAGGEDRFVTLIGRHLRDEEPAAPPW